MIENPEEQQPVTIQEESKTGFVPPPKKRPDDEFFDLATLSVLATTDIAGDGSIVKLVVTEGVGAFVDPEDIVYYRHETRFDNGQLVDLYEQRKVADTFKMNDPLYHDFLRLAFLQMRKNEVAFVKVSQ